MKPNSLPMQVLYVRVRDSGFPRLLSTLVFIGRSFTSGGQGRGLCLAHLTAVCKLQANKRYIESLPFNRRSCFSQGERFAVQLPLDARLPSWSRTFIGAPLAVEFERGISGRQICMKVLSNLLQEIDIVLPSPFLSIRFYQLMPGKVDSQFIIQQL